MSMDRIKKISKVNPLFLFKTGFGSAIAILLADSLGFLYSPSAGIITLLTIQSTKKETITIAIRRLIAFLLGSLITYVIFQIFGYSPIAFGAFVFSFVAICFLSGLKDGIAMNAVLMTHFLIEKRMDIPLLLNELGLLTIGMGIGIILNLIMPSIMKKIRKDQLHLEEEIKKTLRKMSLLLKEKESCLLQEVDISERRLMKAEYSPVYEKDKQKDTADKETYVREFIDFNSLEAMVETLLKAAYEEAGNTLLSDTRYLVSYLEMRKLQLDVLKDITVNIVSIPVIIRQTFPIADFIDSVATSFHELNNVEGLLIQLEKLKEHYRKDMLPQTREEFEYRATLFQILKELEYFLLLKRNFVMKLDRENMNNYWKL